MTRKSHNRPTGRPALGPAPLVSIVIPNYHRFDLLEKCLKAIPAAFGEIPYEIILVENGSPPEEKVPFFRNNNLPEKFRLIELTKNIGYPGACNRGAKEAKAPLLFILTNDVIMEPGSGEALVMAMDDAQVGIVGMKLLFPSQSDLTQAGLKTTAIQRPPERVQHVGLFTNIHAQVFHMYVGWSADNPRVNAVRDVYAVTGAALMTRRNLFIDLWGFDSAYGAGTYEDVDYAMKVREKGLKIIVEVKAVGHHYTGATAEKYNAAFPLNQNRQIFEQKWYNKLVWTEWVGW